jgi:hypothetical protein
VASLFIKHVAKNMSAVADHVRQVMSERGAHVRGALSTRSTHEAYAAGYKQACDDVADFIETVEVEEK